MTGHELETKKFARNTPDDDDGSEATFGNDKVRKTEVDNRDDDCDINEDAPKDRRATSFAAKFKGVRAVKINGRDVNASDDIIAVADVVDRQIAGANFCVSWVNMANGPVMLGS